MFHVYILELADGSYYVGHTNNLERRLKEHALGVACTHTSVFPMRKVCWFEKHTDRVSASKREKEIKGWRREKKEKLLLGSSMP